MVLGFRSLNLECTCDVVSVSHEKFILKLNVSLRQAGSL